ncbi:DUF3562 domain-containing protein [Ralstonia insidiosa]|uniref:DUF3562 domain-containing protein n=1 Tax=Ralstonia TaxID=48736 RepID=UPI000664BEA1|nr:DUF3562 domain-containing protein [Ralstonia insidiosa]KMW47001.1 hypothetical protein AC240_11785 [Ralstonia sp. MD27]MBX3775508.1 DUF3562 domain-containing protein [Ralstonia pickettii]MBA9859645.1 DUF3562 domain-containing protein [Ralstonia insidiosa]MBA9873241.1 DUF3562 domain-containing protein [Ralstonia insidiosa]MBA9916199.1 DUF3562 domain-containing protein [Ralstonia insidiosa]
MADASAQVTDPELHEAHYAYVLDISDRVGLPPDVVAPVFRETLRTLSAGATVETYVVLLAAKKTLSRLRTAAGANGTFHDEF